MKSVDVRLDLWKWSGCVFNGGTSAQFTAIAKRDWDQIIESQEHAAGHAHLEAGKPWLIWLESLNNCPTLAHEALHITAGLLEARGLKFTEASEEAYTYTMESIMRQVLDPKAKWQKVRLTR